MCRRRTYVEEKSIPPEELRDILAYGVSPRMKTCSFEVEAVPGVLDSRTNIGDNQESLSLQSSTSLNESPRRLYREGACIIDGMAHGRDR